MPKIVSIVEGPGEVEAVPSLLGRLLVHAGRYDVFADKQPLNAHSRSNLTKSGGIERFVKSALLRREVDAILVLVDADSDCPRDLAISLAERVRAIDGRVRAAVVCAKHMYEAWFLASIATVSGQRLNDRDGLPRLEPITDPEATRNPKKWLDDRMPKGRVYKETQDQVAMTRLIDIELTRQSSRSFRRLLSAVDQLLNAIDANEPLVTPFNRAQDV